MTSQPIFDPMLTQSNHYRFITCLELYLQYLNASTALTEKIIKYYKDPFAHIYYSIHERLREGVNDTNHQWQQQLNQMPFPLTLW